MSKSFSRIAAGAVALAFVAGTASAQLEYYAITTDGSLHYVNGGVDTVVGNTGMNNSVNSLALNWQRLGGDGNYWQSAGFAGGGFPPSGVTGTVDVGTAATSTMYNLSDSFAHLFDTPLGGGIAYDTDGSLWQISSNIGKSTATLFHYDLAGNQISAVDVGINGTVGALYARSDGAMIVGDTNGTLYTVDRNTGNISSANATGLAGLAEFSTGPVAFDALLDVAYAVTNVGSTASIFRINIFNGQVSLEDTFDVSGTGAMWGLQVIPSPASAALLGLGGLVATRRRRS